MLVKKISDVMNSDFDEYQISDQVLMLVLALKSLIFIINFKKISSFKLKIKLIKIDFFITCILKKS